MKYTTIAVLIAFSFFWVGFSAVGAWDEETRTAAARGTAYLKKAIVGDRYILACSASDGSSCPVHNAGHVFAGFFIADSIGDELTTAEKARITDRLDRESRQGVWGYTPYAPVDSDDTTFVIRTYRLLGRDAPPDPLMRFYASQKKGFTTFDSDNTATVTLAPSVTGNRGIHPEVNAGIFALLVDTPMSGLVNEDIIAASQTGRGDWPSYFYPGPYYGTYMGLNLLCRTGRLKTARSRGLSFLISSQNSDGSWGSPGSVYETSLALNGLAACGAMDDSFRKGSSWLLSQQGQDGSWRSDNIVVWEYTYRDNPSVVWRAFDTGGIITTALAVKALRSFRGTAR